MIQRNVALFLGIGASQVDRNSLADLENAKPVISQSGYDNRKQPWPGTGYFEDVSAQAQLKMIEIIVQTALENGAIS